MTDDDAGASGGLFAGAGALGTGLFRLLGLRASYALLELGDARDALLRVLLFGAAALIAAGLALVGLSALLIVLFWHLLGGYIVLILTVAYSLLAGLLLWRAQRIVAAGQVGLPVTLAELRKDRAALFGDAERAAQEEA